MEALLHDSESSVTDKDFLRIFILNLPAVKYIFLPIIRSRTLG